MTESAKPKVVDEKPQVLSIKPKKKPQAKHSYSTRATIVENEPQVCKYVLLFIWLKMVFK